MVAPVAAFGVAHPFSRLSGEVSPRLGRERRSGLSISAAARSRRGGLIPDRRQLGHAVLEPWIGKIGDAIFDGLMSRISLAS